MWTFSLVNPIFSRRNKEEKFIFILLNEDQHPQLSVTMWNSQLTRYIFLVCLPLRCLYLRVKCWNLNMKLDCLWPLISTDPLVQHREFLKTKLLLHSKNTAYFKSFKFTINFSPLISISFIPSFHSHCCCSIAHRMISSDLDNFIYFLPSLSPQSLPQACRQKNCLQV